MFQSPSYHHISPMSRSRSEVRPSPLMRSTTFAAPPAYGYGGGYMSRTLTRSGSTLFGRSLRSSALQSTPPLHSIAVQRNTPHYSDKYPYVRYSYGNIDTSLGVSAQTSTIGRSHSSPRATTTRQFLEGKWNPYTTNLHKSPSYTSRVERPLTPSRNYVKYMPIDDALSMYKKRCMTVGTLSKYWLSPSTWQSRREKEANMSYSISTGQYNYASRYTRPHFSYH